MKKHKGKVITVKFFDHVQDDIKPVVCTAVGILQIVDKNYIVIQTWDCPDMDETVRLANSNFFTILRSTIVEVKVSKDFVTVLSKVVKN